MSTVFYFRSDVRMYVCAFLWSIGLVLMFASWNCFAATFLLSPEKIVRQAVVEHLLQSDESLLKNESAISSGNVKDLVRYRLDRGLSKFVTATGTGLTFTKPGRQSERYIDTWVITYRDKKTAQKMSELPVMKSGYFRRTKILTPFSYAVVDRHLVIVFTESAGDGDVVRLIKSIPELLHRQQNQDGLDVKR
jgi:hypothetical protein